MIRALKYAVNISKDQDANQAAVPIKSKKLQKVWMAFNDVDLLHLKEDIVLIETVVVIAMDP